MLKKIPIETNRAFLLNRDKIELVFSQYISIFVLVFYAFVFCTWWIIDAVHYFLN